MTGADLDKLSPEELAQQISNPQQSLEAEQPITGSEIDKLSPEDLANKISGNEDGTILKNPTQITQSFGTVNPIEPTAGNRAGDTNFAANAGDEIAAPPGEWQVIKAYNQANPVGAPGDYADNSGWGNDVWLKDTKTGQVIHFLHMSDVNASPGETIKGGQIVGTVGDSGNSTGNNLGVEYYDQQGDLGDFMQSPYAKSLPLIGSQNDPLSHS